MWVGVASCVPPLSSDFVDMVCTLILRLTRKIGTSRPTQTEVLAGLAARHAAYMMRWITA
jgi:hypothetical protein